MAEAPASPSPSGPEAIAQAFAKGHPALVVYLMAGYPDRAGSLAAVRAAIEGGADIIELGVPYGDALADGPVIAQAAAAAMGASAGGFGLAETIDLARELISTHPSGAPARPPVLLMTYINPLLRMGFRPAAEKMRAAGIAGVIVPDMPPEMARPWLAEAAGLATVFLVAPTSTPERIRLVAEGSSGFVYCVSTTGVTGEREALATGIERTVDAVRARTATPVAVGFGISTAEQAAEVARFADGVIVGSACVRNQHDPSALKALVQELVLAVHC